MQHTAQFVRSFFGARIESSNNPDGDVIRGAIEQPLGRAHAIALLIQYTTVTMPCLSGSHIRLLGRNRLGGTIPNDLWSANSMTIVCVRVALGFGEPEFGSGTIAVTQSTVNVVGSCGGAVVWWCGRRCECDILDCCLVTQISDYVRAILRNYFRGSSHRVYHVLVAVLLCQSYLQQQP